MNGDGFVYVFLVSKLIKYPLSHLSFLSRELEPYITLFYLTP